MTTSNEGAARPCWLRAAHGDVLLGEGRGLCGRVVSAGFMKEAEHKHVLERRGEERDGQGHCRPEESAGDTP